MNVFELRNRLIQDYASYISSFIEIRDQKIKQTDDWVVSILDQRLDEPNCFLQLVVFLTGETFSDTSHF